MAIAFSCPHCGRGIETSSAEAGAARACPYCGSAFVVPRAGEARRIALPSAGNAGSAAAAYGALAGLAVDVFLPDETPEPFRLEAAACGASVHLVRGDISSAGAALRAHPDAASWLDVSTLKEPYRCEGKKTMGDEIAEQLGWTLPDVIVYPTGGGTGLVGMWKAFEEMEQLGLVEEGRRPRMIAVQAAGCAPIVEAFERRVYMPHATEQLKAFLIAHNVDTIVVDDEHLDTWRTLIDSLGVEPISVGGVTVYQLSGLGNAGQSAAAMRSPRRFELRAVSRRRRRWNPGRARSTRNSLLRW